MVARVEPTTAPSPLSRLAHRDRQLVIDALTARLPREDAVAVLTALAGSAEELAAVPFELQERAQGAILAALPPIHNAVVASELGIVMKGDEESLEDVLTEQEQRDPAFRRRVEEVARDRGIQRWLAAIRLRHERMNLEEIAAAVQHRHPSRETSDASRTE